MVRDIRPKNVDIVSNGLSMSMRSQSLETHLALTVGPEIDSHPHKVVDAWIRALVQEQRRQRTQWVYDQPRLDTPMHDRLGELGGA